jgi:selenocysteine lyase/cysteine desulfurase
MRHYQDLAEAYPDRFIRYDYPKLLDGSRKHLANYLRAPVDNIVFVPNVTVGINTVLRNLKYESGDQILYFSTLYGACEKTVEYVCETTAATSMRLPLQYPLSDHDLLATFRAGLVRAKEEGGRVKIAIFDVLSSLPGVCVPFVELTDICKKIGVLTLIDGAHAPGQVPIDLGKLQPDFFIGNCHKYVKLPRKYPKKTPIQTFPDNDYTDGCLHLEGVPFSMFLSNINRPYGHLCRHLMALFL